MYSILIVDDEVIAIEAMREQLKNGPQEITKVYSATNILDAKKIMHQEPIDILLCDIEMPGGSGIDLLQWLQDNDPSIVCVFLTCHTSFDYAKKAINLGALDYLLKPVDEKELNNALIRAMDRKKQQKTMENAEILLGEVAQSSIVEDSEKNKNHRVVEQIKELIQRNLSGELSREDLAAQVYLNPDYMARIFKKETGQSLGEYIYHMKMGVACRLLRDTDLSVSKIALSCGYSHMAHFSQVFRKETGMTPREYRTNEWRKHPEKSE